MTEQNARRELTPTLFIARFRHAVVAALLLTGGLLASMALIEWVQRTVAPYHPRAFEEAAREALTQGKYRRVVTICTGNLHYAKNRFPSYGLCRLLRARGYFGLGERGRAFEDLVIAERYWRKWHGRASETERAEVKDLATEMAMAALGFGETSAARQLFSLAGTGSGAPLAFLAELHDKLTPQMRAKIWPQQEMLIVENFMQTGEPILETWAERTSRTVETAFLDASPDEPGAPGRFLRITASLAPESGMSWYCVPFFMPIPETPCRFRAILKANAGPPPRFLLGLAHPATGQGGTIFGETPEKLAEGSYAADVMLPGQDSSKTPDYVVRVGFALPTEACEYVIKRIELFPDSDAGTGTDGQE
ncbi:MAG: hypothetical protein ACOX5J_11255 [Candidatus Hydrogenedentales bacterium]|jgi:hypothetical protein